MGRSEKNADVDMAQETEHPLGSRIADAALERWELLDRARSKQRRARGDRELRGR
jgi:hypothetical protein